METPIREEICYVAVHSGEISQDNPTLYHLVYNPKREKFEWVALWADLSKVGKDSGYNEAESALSDLGSNIYGVFKIIKCPSFENEKDLLKLFKENA